ncbi:MAG TPA: transglutaminase family protein [Candidatus Limnocylindria bacterium]
MRISVEHRTKLSYSGDVQESVMDARVGPRTDEHQRWISFDLKVEPAASVRRYNDGFGNAAHLITVARPHRSIEVVMRGEIETTLADPFQDPRGRPPELSPSNRADFLGPSTLVPPAPELKAMAEPFREEPAFDAVRKLMHLVHERFEYRPDITDVETTVVQVLSGASGVCQDLAHVLIGLCRAIAIPSRYVSGYILAGTERDEPTLGAAASHAWMEAYTATHGWRGFDPTNDLLASEHHVKMAVGRDYHDVPPTRGTFRGAADEALAVAVTTRPVTTPGSSGR